MSVGRINIAKLVAFAAIGFCIFRTWKFLKRETKNDCAMTFMWRMMNYMDVGFKYGDRYSLILYGEGAYAYNFVQNQRVNGIPVIFIPGNAGSGRQVRSLGSVLQNKTELLNTPFRFDTFAVDFNEELSGFSSEYLDLQKDYLSHAIDYIWSMYESPPQGIVLVGHSMGGVVARSLLVDSKFDASRISLVLTFATPHTEPPYPLDKRMTELWTGLNVPPQSSGKPYLPRVVSVSGGLKDELIDETWTADPSVFHVSTTEIDSVWLETDHQCIVWCNQLVRHTSRILFDYARDPTLFRSKPDNVLWRHYRSVGKKLTIPKESNATTSNVGIDQCTPRCPSSGKLSVAVDDSLTEKYILVISRATSRQLIDVQPKPRSFPGNGDTRLLTASSAYALADVGRLVGHRLHIDLEDRSVWIVGKNGTVGSTVPLAAHPLLPFGGSHRLSLAVGSGLRMVNINTEGAPLNVYRIQLQRHCGKGNGHRVLWTTSKVRRFEELENSATVLYAYGHNETDTSGTLWFMDASDCSYDVVIRVDRFSSIVKILRRYREKVVLLFVAGLVGIAFTCVLRSKLILWLLLPWITAIVLLVPWAAAVLVSTCIVALAACFVAAFLLLRPLVDVAKRFRFKVANRSARMVLGVCTVFAIAAHSFVPLVLASVFNLFAIWSQYRDSARHFYPLCMLILTTVLLQLPSGITYFWNLAKYRQVIASSNTFLDAALVSIAASFLSITPLNRPGVLATRLCSAAVLALVIVRNPSHFLVALDDLSIICALALVILWHTTGTTEHSIKVKSK